MRKERKLAIPSDRERNKEWGGKTETSQARGSRKIFLSSMSWEESQQALCNAWRGDELWTQENIIHKKVVPSLKATNLKILSCSLPLTVSSIHPLSLNFSSESSINSVVPPLCVFPNQSWKSIFAAPNFTHHGISWDEQHSNRRNGKKILWLKLWIRGLKIREKI